MGGVTLFKVGTAAAVVGSGPHFVEGAVENLDSKLSVSGLLFDART